MSFFEKLTKKSAMYLVLIHDRRLTECWSQLGASLRTAQALGLHRDGTRLGLEYVLIVELHPLILVLFKRNTEGGCGVIYTTQISFTAWSLVDHQAFQTVMLTLSKLLLTYVKAC
jgi:hypothetical protein